MTGQEGSSMCSKLLGDALSDTSEFLTILRPYGSEWGGQLTATDNSSSSISGTRLGIIVILNLLSVYLQIVVIYDKLFQYLSKQIFDGAELQTLSVLQVAAFSVQRGNLQIKMLIRSILHQFEMIERILGLPADYRVTDKRDDYSGLFEDRRARDMLEAVGTSKCCHTAIDDSCALKALCSLREMLEKVQVFLNI
jgi:hypothetical protein